MQCDVQKNKTHCTCTYAYCDKKGKCCACVAYHRRNGEVPGCFFPPEAEKTYNRSMSYFLEVVRGVKQK